MFLYSWTWLWLFFLLSNRSPFGICSSSKPNLFHLRSLGSPGKWYLESSNIFIGFSLLQSLKILSPVTLKCLDFPHQAFSSKISFDFCCLTLRYSRILPLLITRGRILREESLYMSDLTCINQESTHLFQRFQVGSSSSFLLFYWIMHWVRVLECHYALCL